MLYQLLIRGTEFIQKRKRKEIHETKKKKNVDRKRNDHFTKHLLVSPLFQNALRTHRIQSNYQKNETNGLH